VLVLDLIENLQGTLKYFALTGINSLQELLLHLSKSLIMCVGHDIDGVIFIVDLIVEHVVIVLVELKLLVLIELNRLSLSLAVSAFNFRPNTTVRDLSQGVDCIDVSLQGSIHKLLLLFVE
jgi:hypothetical protein